MRFFQAYYNSTAAAYIARRLVILQSLKSYLNSYVLDRRIPELCGITIGATHLIQDMRDSLLELRKNAMICT